MLKYKITTEPSVEPVTLQEAKLHLGSPENEVDLDAVITSRIVEARLWIENFLNRKLIQQEIEIVLDDFPIYAIECPTANLISITNIKYYDTNDVEQTLGSVNYTLDNYGLRHWILLAQNVDWPATNCAANNVKIRALVGYGPSKEDVPALIKEALKMIVGHWHHYQAAIESGVSVDRIPLGVLDMLRHYKRDRF